MSLHFFELRKVPSGELDPKDMLHLWLWLLKATTEEEEPARLKALEVPVVEQVINAYTRITSDAEFREIKRQRELARHNEASALNTRERKTRKTNACGHRLRSSKRSRAVDHGVPSQQIRKLPPLEQRMFHAIETVATLPDCQLSVRFRSCESKAYDMGDFRARHEAFTCPTQQA